MKNLITLALIFIGALSHGQGIFNMVNDGATAPVRYVTCSGSFNDDGGNGDYSNNFNGTASFCPGISTDRMQLNFIQLIIQTGDVLTIFDGDSAAAPVLGTFTNTTTAPGMFQASAGNPSGCLTVRFTSNGSGTGAGWRAGITCFDPCQTISTNIVTTPAPDADGIVRICQGDTVNFDGSATFGTDGTGATYEWDLGNGGGLNPGAIQSETYVTTGIYLINFKVTDATGCSDREERDVVVHVSSDPDFTGTAASDTTLCYGESTNIIGVVTPVEFAITPSPPITGQTFLPDGSGVSYTTCVNVDLFPPGATMTNAADLVDIFVNMEHSYLGDLDLSITAPNGATVSLHTYPSGGGTFLGIPIDPGVGPGTGFDYVFTESATQTWAQIQASVATIPAGDYLPVDPYSTFVGTPLNGQWCINITDNLGSDDGYIFYWGLNFNPAIIPSDLSFTPIATSEQWLPDPSITNTTGNTITVTPTTAGTNCYTYEFIDNFNCTYTEVVCIDVFPEILNGVPLDFSICDPSGAAATVDLTTRDVEVLNGLASTDYSVSYHLTQSDAENGVGAIGTPTAFTNTLNPQTIYAAITDIMTSCIVVESFDITVGSATYNTVPDIDLCDDPSNDGFETFDLTSQEAGILGTQSAADFNVTYHVSQIDADNGVNAIPNPAGYVNVQSPSETIFVRIENVTDATCNDTGTFDITVSPTPVANTPMDMIACDDISNDGIGTFILSSRTGMVLGTQNPVDFNVTYHGSQSDADNNAMPLTSSGYLNAGTGPEIIYVRVESALNDSCYNTTSFIIQVDPQAVFNTANDLVVCDDASNDGFEIFDLTQNESDILGSQNPADFTISYHNSQADADANTAAIPNPATYSNVISPQETIFVRVTPVGNATCIATGDFDLIINATPVANPVGNLVLCDDDTNDGTEVFDLGAQTANILGAQNPADFNISYHSSQADADSNTAPLSLNFNNSSSPQTIFVRVENVNSGVCVETTDFTIQVDPQAVYNIPNDLVVCDDASNDGFEIFDLTQNESDILGTQNPADFTISYHNSQADADANTAAIPNPATYSNIIATQETIFVRITPVGNIACFDTGSFTINVNPIAIANLVGDLTLCDDPSNDGTEIYDLGAQTATVLGIQNPADVNITYHGSQADADANIGALALNYNNTNSPETIYVRAENVNDTDCFTTTTFDLILNPAPILSAASNLELCDDPSGDGTENFDLSQNESIILNGLNPADYLISYHTSQGDANSGSAGIAVNYDNTTSPETIYVRVENILTSCFNTTTFDLILNSVPTIANVSNLEECDEDGDTLAVFALNERENDIINGQSGVVVTYYASNLDAVNDTAALDENTYSNTTNPQVISYRLTTTSTGCFSIGTFTIEAVPVPVVVMPMDVENCDDGSGNALADLNGVTGQIIGAQTGLTVSYHESQTDADNDLNSVSLNYDYSSDVTLFVRVEDDNTDCVSFTTVNLVLLPLPQPSLLSQYVLCIDPNGVLLNGPEILDTGLNNTDYIFEWFLNGTLIAGSSSAIHNATEPGDYEVMVTTIATGCENSTTTNVRQSGIPTAYDVEVTTDTYAVDHQVIATATGPDEYWFRLDDGPYVNSGIFNNVTPGLHNVTIAERSGCGEIVVEVFVFGYPDYFTPNNDGFHDTWNIIGADRLPATTLYIFDRYGKLLKQLDTTGPGWDGTYNGQPLPSSDYWFTIDYEQDGRKGQATGHFAMKR